MDELEQQQLRGLHEDLSYKTEVAQWRLMERLRTMGLSMEHTAEIIKLVEELSDCIVEQVEWSNS